MRVAILGAGGIGLASAAQLVSHGHVPVLWSPSGKGLTEIAENALVATGAVAGRFPASIALELADAVHDAAAILIAVPATARRALFDALAPLLTRGQTVIVSAELSLGAHYLRRRAGADGVGIAALSTTPLTGRRTGIASVEVGALRQGVGTATISGSPEQSLATCRALFGDRFHLVPALAILLGNLNPQVHMANVLCNLTRVEKGEAWANYDGITPAVARLIEGLDRERLMLAAACGAVVRSVEQHFQSSFGLADGASLAAMAAEIHRVRGGPPGPTNLSTRFITEDLPFGIVPLLKLAALHNSPMLLHAAGLTLLDQLCGTDHALQNDLLESDLLRAL